MSTLYFPDRWTLHTWFFGFCYKKYMCKDQWYWKLPPEDKYTFLLFVWYSEGCPEF